MQQSTDDAVETELRDIIATNLKIDRGVIQRGSKLADWGGDSLLFLETIFEVETHFNIQFPETQPDKITDYDALLALVKAQIAKSAAKAQAQAKRA